MERSNGNIKDTESERSITMETNYKMIVFAEDGLSLDVRVDAEKETVWLTQAEMAELFGIERPVVLYHLRMLYRNEELSQEATCTKIVQVQTEGNRTVKRERPIYNLDAILSVGYRVNSKRGIAFRKWASTVLKHYLFEGYAANEKRLAALNRTVEVQRALLTHYAEGSGVDSVGLSLAGVKKIVGGLTESGLLAREGSKKAGRWVALK